MFQEEQSWLKLIFLSGTKEYQQYSECHCLGFLLWYQSRDQNPNLGIIPQELSTLIFETRSLTLRLTTCRFDYAGWLEGS